MVRRTKNAYPPNKTLVDSLLTGRRTTCNGWTLAPFASASEFPFFFFVYFTPFFFFFFPFSPFPNEYY